MGGMGSVWTVQDRADGRLKAAKILRQSDAASLLRFVREQSVRIDHPHVVTPESWAGMDDRVLFTMPLVAGGSVADLLKDHGALPLPWIGVLLDQLLAALEAVHAAGIVHRDVKPANLLLEPTGGAFPHLRLTDFGIAVPLDDARLTHGPVAVGSPGYMAPEQWNGGEVTPRHDLYAVGRVGLEMLTGVRPATGSNDVAVEHLPEPRQVSVELVRILRGAAAEDPDERPADAAGLRSALAALRLAEVPATGAPISIGDRVTPAHPGVHDAPTTVGQDRRGGPSTEVAADPAAATRFEGSGGTRVERTPATAVDRPLPTRYPGGPQRSASAPDRTHGRPSALPAYLLIVGGLIALLAGLYVLVLA